MSGHGYHWSACKGGSFNGSDVIQIAVILGVGCGIAMIIVAYAWAVITAAVAALAVRGWFLYRKVVITAAIAAKGEAMRLEQAGRAAAGLAVQRAHEIEVARAGAMVIQNIIDPAALLAAALAAPHAMPQPVRVVRAEVER